MRASPDQNLHLVLVENDDNDVFFIERALRRAGYPFSMTRLHDGQAAIEYFERESAAVPPDVVLLDVQMPRRNGFEVLEWLRAQPAYQNLTVMIRTSSDDPADMRRARALGASDFLTKRADCGEIVDGLARWPGRSGLGAAAVIDRRYKEDERDCAPWPGRYAPTMAELQLDDLRRLLLENCMLRVPPEEIQMDTTLFGPGSLNLDSIDALQLTVGIEKAFGIAIKDPATAREAFQSVSTLAAVSRLAKALGRVSCSRGYLARKSVLLSLSKAQTPSQLPRRGTVI